MRVSLCLEVFSGTKYESALEFHTQNISKKYYLKMR